MSPESDADFIERMSADRYLTDGTIAFESDLRHKRGEFDRLLALARRGAAPAGEPVGWLVEGRGSYGFVKEAHQRDRRASEGYSTRPLYAAPPAPSAGVARVAAAMKAVQESCDITPEEMRAALEAAALIR